MAEVLFKNDNGVEVYLPEATGRKLGYDVSEAYVPEELKETPADDVGSADGGDGFRKPVAFSDAVAAVRHFVDTASDEEKTDELMGEVESLGVDLLQFAGKDQKTEKEHLSDAIATVHSIASRGEETVMVADKEMADGIDMLAANLSNYGFGPQPVKGSGEPSLVDAIKVVEAHIETSTKITDNNKDVTKKQLAKLLEPAE